MAQEEQHDDRRQDQHVQVEETPQGGGADLIAATQADEQEVADPGHGAGDVGADLGRPVRLLVPGEQVAGEPEAQGDHEEHHAGEPCLLYTSDAADDLLCVDLGGRRIIKKKKNIVRDYSYYRYI